MPGNAGVRDGWRMKETEKTNNPAPQPTPLFPYPLTRLSREQTLLEYVPQGPALWFCKSFLLSHVKLMSLFSCTNFQKFITYA